MHILIIEDEKGIVDFLKQGLEEEEGFIVSFATNGKEGLDLAISLPVDLILLDWMLPKMTGIQVCQAIRLQKDIPIIFLTAKDTVQETIEGLKAGANDYIKKPFSFDELLERIKIHFRNNGSYKILTLGNITLDKNKFQVFVNETEVVLTHREFELLEYLIKNKGTVCTRNKIIEDVWNIHFEYDTGVIDVFMNAIRKKLNLTKDEELIKTIRGVGYIAND